MPAGSLPGDVPFDTLSALPDGRVLVLAATVPRAASILDPATGRLEPTGRSAAWRSYPATFQLTDGRTLILGGDITPDRSGATSGSVGPSTAEVYDPAAGTFSSLGPTVIPRWQEATTVLKDGRVFVTGGVVAPVQGTTPIASTEFFDPSTLTFGAGPAMTVARNGHSMATLSDGRVLIVGGTWQDEDNSRENSVRRAATTHRQEASTRPVRSRIARRRFAAIGTRSANFRRLSHSRMAGRSSPDCGARRFTTPLTA